MDTNTKVNRKILMIASNPATSPVSGWPIGFWWAELTHPWLTFTEAGYDVVIASPDGGDLVGDGYSDPQDESGYSAGDIISLGFKLSPTHSALLKGTRKLADVDWRDFDALMIVGGQGPMVTMIDNDALHRTFVEAHDAGKIVCAICHGTCILLKTRRTNGELLVAGRTWTGFADSEEEFAEQAAGIKLQPFWIETQAAEIENTNFVTAQPFAPFAIRDGNLITGQQQNSGVAAAKLVIEALGR
ncbi:MAG: type 1 glutamine amidotransferase domain-containing protein [Pseudomonadota bacterium]